MKKRNPLILISCLTVMALCRGQAPEFSSAENGDAWAPFPGAEKVASGVVIDWKAPAAGTVYFAESTRELCFLTKSIDAGERFTTLDGDGNIHQPIGEAVDASIPGVDDQEVMSTLRFHLFFKPDAVEKDASAEVFEFSLLPDGVHLGGEASTPEQLKSALAELPANAKIKITADPSMPHKDVIRMLELCKEAGFSDVAIAVAK